MAVQYSEIQELLRSRADLNARLSLMPYDGTPEIKERGDGKYLYVRKRVAGKQTSTYVGAYTEELYNLLLHNAREAREIRKSLRSIEKQLAAAGYSEDDLSADVINNIAFALQMVKNSSNLTSLKIKRAVTLSFSIMIQLYVFCYVIKKSAIPKGIADISYFLIFIIV